MMNSSDHPRRVHFISTLHVELLKTVRSKEFARQSNIDETGPAWEVDRGGDQKDSG